MAVDEGGQLPKEVRLLVGIDLEALKVVMVVAVEGSTVDAGVIVSVGEKLGTF